MAVNIAVRDDPVRQKIQDLVVRMATENRDCRVRKSLEEEELMTS